MAIVDKTVNKQCPNCGAINTLEAKVDDASQEAGTMRVRCHACEWRFKVQVIGLVQEG